MAVLQGTKEQGYIIKQQTQPKPFGKKGNSIQQTDEVETNRAENPPVLPVGKPKIKSQGAV